jgi:acyl dehydratase
MMSTAYVSELMTTRLGAGFVVGGELDVSFTRPVVVGDVLTVGGVVVTGPPGEAGDRLVARVWCRNQRGELTMVGTAGGRSR